MKKTIKKFNVDKFAKKQVIHFFKSLKKAEQRHINEGTSPIISDIQMIEVYKLSFKYIETGEYCMIDWLTLN